MYSQPGYKLFRRLSIFGLIFAMAPVEGRIRGRFVPQGHRLTSRGHKKGVDRTEPKVFRFGVATTHD